MFAGIKASDSEMITNSAFTTCFLGSKALFIDVAKQCAKVTRQPNGTEIFRCDIRSI